MKRTQNGWIAGFIAIGIAFTAVMATGGARTADPLGIAVSPQTLLLGAVQSDSVKVHTDIPLSLVEVSTLRLNGLPAIGAYADALGHLVAVFDEAAVKAIVSPPSAVMTLTGAYRTGAPFAGSDTVSVVVAPGV